MKYMIGVGAISFVNLGIVNDASIAAFNLPIIVPIMAAGGAMLSFAYDDDNSETTKLTKKRVIILVIANTLLTTAAVSVFPAWLGWDWYDSKLQGSLALLLAAGAKFVIPLAIRTLPEIIRKWFKIGEYSTQNIVEEVSDETK